jgi:N4-gp56 family major capsid protein
MAIDGNAYLYNNVDADGQSNITPELWAEQIYTRAFKASLLPGLMGLGIVRQDNTILGRSGNKFTLPKMDLLSASDLTEGTPTPVSALNFDGVEVTTRERGIATQMSTRAVDVSVSSFEQTIVANMSGALAEKLNSDLIAELGTTATSAIYPIKTGSTRYVTGDIVATASLTLEQINEADTQMVAALNKRAVAVVIHPRQEKALRDDDQFIYASQYGDASVLRTGEIGRLYGMTIFVSNHVESALENTDVTVYKALVLGEQACVYAPKRPTVFMAGPLDAANLDRAVTLHSWTDYGFANFEEAAIIPIKSA